MGFNILRTLKTFLSLLFLASFSYAEPVLPEKPDLDVIDEFHGGNNTQMATGNLQNHQAINNINWIIDEKPGSLIKVGSELFGGSTIVGSTQTLSKVTTMIAYNKDDGSREFIASDSSIVITTVDFSSFGILQTALNMNYLVRGKQIKNKIWLWNGKNNPMVYNGSSITAMAYVPKFKYGEFDQGRVWGLATDTHSSGLVWSDNASTDSIIIQPDDPRAWPPLNILHAGQGDGYIGTALWVYKGQLYVGKENSIYTRMGTDNFSYELRRTGAEVGPISNDSVVVQDVYTYYVGRQGGQVSVYRFDGVNSVRISDLISPDIGLARVAQNQIGQNIWDTFQQFTAENTKLSGATVTSNGNVTVLATQTIVVGGIHFPPTTPKIFLSGGGVLTATTTHFCTVSTSGVSATNLYAGYLGRTVTFYIDNNGSLLTPSSANWVTVTFLNRRTGSTIVSASTAGIFGAEDGPAYQYAMTFTFGSTFALTTEDIILGSIALKVDVDTAVYRPNTFIIDSMTLQGCADYIIVNATGNYLSQITTITSLAAWDTFDALTNPSGGTINYFYKTATGSPSMQDAVWTSIFSGSVIGSSNTNNYIQWTATINALTPQTDSNIDRVLINSIQGQSADTRPITFSWKNRLWVITSTESTGNISRIFLKTKITNTTPDAWTFIHGINAKSVVLFNNNFYAGSSTAGVFMRLDNGSSFNGSPVEAIYETGDRNMGLNFFQKDLNRFLFDMTKCSGCNITFGISQNGGSFTNTNISLDGTGTALKVLPGSQYHGAFFRYKILNSELDKSPEFNGMGTIYSVSQRDASR